MKKLAALVLIAFSIGGTGCERALDVLLSEPAPPVLRPVDGIRVIRVTVTNVSEQHRLIPAFVAEEIAKQLNVYSNGLHPFAADDAKNADAVLAVSILEESGRVTHSDPRSDTVEWKFKVKFSSTLKRTDGQVILSRPMQSVSQELGWTGFTRAGVAPGWDESIVRQDLVWRMGDRLVSDLVHLR
jgi:hypothetical protein